MKKFRKVSTMFIMVLCVLGLFAGPAAADLLVYGDFEGVPNSAGLRGGSYGWYESSTTPAPNKVILNDAASSPLWGNSSKMALLNGQETTTGSAYLTQNFSSPQTGNFRISFDIAIDSIFNRTTSGATDSTGFIFVGQGIGTTGGPNNPNSERFVYLGFYDTGNNGGSTGQGMHMMANNNVDRVTNDNTLSYDTWYTITLAINVGAGTYDVTVDDKYGSATYIQKTGINRFSNVTPESLSFYINGPDDLFGSGVYYVDNVSAVPIPGAVWLLGSGLLGLVAIRRRFKK